MPRGLEHVGRAHHIGSEGLERLAIGASHQRLSGEVEHDFGTPAGEDRTHILVIADVAHGRAEAALQPAKREERRRGAGRQRQAGDDGAHIEQPDSEPAAFEAGVAGNQHAPAAPELAVHHRPRQTAQAAAPVSHRLLRSWVSR